MKFTSMDINASDYKDEDDLIEKINNQLANKINFLRLNINGLDDFNIKKIKKNLQASYIDINLSQDESFDNIARLYPNSLLSKFDGKFNKETDPIKLRARDLGIEAILRSKK